MKKLISFGLVGLSQACLFAIAPSSLAAESQTRSPQDDESVGVQQLARMFSPEIQNTISACWNRGKVNLAAGANPEGAVICEDGSSEQNVAFTEYVDTVTDILTASSMVGFRTVVNANPQISPELLITYVSGSEGRDSLRSAIQTAIVQSELLPTEAVSSNAFLADQVMNRLLLNLQTPDSLNGLLGSDEQYAQVVQTFCQAPGMSITEARALLPELSSIQLYAICIQESGVTDEALQL